MSKRVANRKGRPRKQVGRWAGHKKTPKWQKRKPLTFDPLQDFLARREAV